MFRRPFVCRCEYSASADLIQITFILSCCGFYCTFCWRAMSVELSSQRGDVMFTLGTCCCKWIVQALEWRMAYYTCQRLFSGIMVFTQTVWEELGSEGKEVSDCALRSSSLAGFPCPQWSWQMCSPLGIKWMSWWNVSFHILKTVVS